MTGWKCNFKLSLPAQPRPVGKGILVTPPECLRRSASARCTRANVQSLCHTGSSSASMQLIIRSFSSSVTRPRSWATYTMKAMSIFTASPCKSAGSTFCREVEKKRECFSYSMQNTLHWHSLTCKSVLSAYLPRLSVKLLKLHLSHLSNGVNFPSGNTCTREVNRFGLCPDLFLELYILLSAGADCQAFLFYTVSYVVI